MLLTLLVTAKYFPALDQGYDACPCVDPYPLSGPGTGHSNCSGILRGGGLPNAAALLVPHDVLMHCVGQGFDTSWAESAYRLYGEASLRIESDSVANDALVDFLDGRP